MSGPSAVAASGCEELLRQAKQSMAQAQYATARSLLEELVGRAPQLAEAHFLLGLVLHDAGLFSWAQQAFERALDRQPSHTEAALCLAVLHNDMGNYAAARKVYERSTQRSRMAPYGADPYILDRLADMHLELAKAYRQAHLVDAALDQVRAARRLCAQRCDILQHEAALLCDLGKASQAARLLEAAAAERPADHPDRAQLAVELGVCRSAMGDRRRAKKSWQSVAPTSPQAGVAARYLRLLGNST